MRPKSRTRIPPRSSFNLTYTTSLELTWIGADENYPIVGCPMEATPV